jgi:hypothetical protein
MTTHNTEAAAVAEIVAEHIKPHALYIEPTEGDDHAPVHLLAIPKGFELKDMAPFIDAAKQRPDMRTGTATLHDLQSFMAHATRFKSNASALFALQEGTSSASLTCVFDYHEPGFNGLPAFLAHKGSYAFPVAEEWTAWHAQNGKIMSQDVFAQWVEGRLLDVLAPERASEQMRELMEPMGTFAGPSRLLELSRGLALRVGAKVAHQVNLSTGETQLQYQTEHTDERGAPVKVPGAFLLGIPVFRNGARYQIAARLRYRIQAGTVSWFYELHRTDRIFDHAFREACEEAQKATGLPLFYGSPEV